MSTPTPLNLTHRVDATVSECGSQTRRLLFGVAAQRAIWSGRRVYALGIRRDGRIVFCSRPGHVHNAPFVIPARDEVELAANDPDYRRPASVVEYNSPGVYVSYLMALGFGWPPGTYQVPWWFE